MSYDVEEEEKMSKDYGDELSGISEGQKNITWWGKQEENSKPFKHSWTNLQ